MARVTRLFDILAVRLQTRSCLLAAFFAAAVGCAPEDHGGQALARMVDGPLDLVRLLDHAHVECEELDRVKNGRPSPRGVLLRDDFDESLHPPWVLYPDLTDPTGRCVAGTGLDPADQRSVGFLVAGAGSMGCAVDTGPEAILVRARLRVEVGADLQGASMFVHPLGVAADEVTSDELSDRRLAQHVAHLDPGRGADWQDLFLTLPRDERRQSVFLRFRAGRETVAVDELEVRRIGRLEASALANPARPLDQSLLRGTMRLGDDVREVIALPVPTTLSYRVRIPEGTARLDASLAGESVPASGGVTVRLVVDGVPVSSRTVPESSAFEPWVVSLDAFAGQLAEVRFEVEKKTGFVDPLNATHRHDPLVADGSVLLLAAPWIFGGRDRARAATPNVILISVDTLRRDMLGCYGSLEGLTPNIDRFAAQGIVFERTLAPSGYTLPSHASMMTGQHPLEHAVLGGNDRLDPVRSPILAERLRGRGYVTAAFSGGGFVDPEFGFGQGFSTYSVTDPGIIGDRRHLRSRRQQARDDEPSAAAVEPILERLAQVADQPFFLFVHSFVVHNYFPYRDYLDPVDARAIHDIEGVDALDADALYSLAVDLGDPAATRRMRDLYRATVRQGDDLLIRPLLEGLEGLGLSDNTIVMLVSDHGEQFLEHGEVGHFGFLWSENVQVPWIVRGPGVPAGARHADVTSLLDIAPTVADLLGLEPDERWSGTSVFDRQGPSPELVLHHLKRWTGYVRGRWKLVVDAGRTSGEPTVARLFRFDRDWEDAEDLSGLNPQELFEMRRLLAEQLERFEEDGSMDPASSFEQLDADLQQRLEALGY